MNDPDLVRLKHMADALDAAHRMTLGLRRADLDTDERTRLALVQALTIAGEATSKIGEGTRATLPEIPWARIVAMRNRLVHAYFDINLDILWTTAATVAPDLAHQISRILGDDAT